MPSLQIKRGTRAQVDSAATASGLNIGELYLITDEGRLAVGTAANSYQDIANTADLAGRASTLLNASSLTASSTDLFTVTLPKSGILQSITVDKPSWIRVYNNLANATADAARARTTDPVAGSGVLLEIITIVESQTIILSPPIVISNMESPVSDSYQVRITNDSETTGVQVIFNHLSLEA